MEHIEEFQKLYDILKNDKRIRTVHISLYMGFFFLWSLKDYKNPIPFSRKKMMNITKINSSATYHKCIKDLTAYGYIHYFPTYHPVNGSLVYINYSKAVFNKMPTFQSH